MALPKDKAPQSDSDSTLALIMNQAEHIVQTRGYNGFSYADIAAELKLTKAAIHHHFPRKADLGLALIERFTRNVLDVMDSIERETDSSVEKLSSYCGLYLGTLKENKMCLCGMMAAEHESLEPRLQAGINEFFDGHMEWLERVLRQGREAGEIRFYGAPRDQARMILSNMQGGLLIAKSQRSFEALQQSSKNLLNLLRVPEHATATASVN